MRMILMSSSNIWIGILVFAVYCIPITLVRYLFYQHSRHYHTVSQYEYTLPTITGFFVRYRRSARDHQFDIIAPREVSFEQRMAAARMKSNQWVVFGQNIFAYDRAKARLMVQTQQVPEGVFLDSRDILAYTLLRDKQVIAERCREGGEGIAAASLSNDCERIELRLEAKHKEYPQITMALMPFRFERAEARESAMDAARRIAEALEDILSERV